MKIVHMSDSHLGFHDVSKVDQEGKNRVEEMIYSGFDRIIEKIIELKPDVVVHAGDVFHHTRPGVKSLYIFKQGLEKLNNNGIPSVIISGNHDTPRSSATTSPFVIYEGIKDVNIAYNKYRHFEIGDYVFHCIPYCPDPQGNDRMSSKIELCGRDVLVMHGMVKSLWDCRTKSVEEYVLDDRFLKSDFDYIALGHLHGRQRVNNNTWYSGSVECFYFKEISQNKGILFADLDRRIVEPVSIRQSIERIDCPSIDCSGFTSEDIITEISNLCSQDGLDDKMIKISLYNVNRNMYKNINHAQLNELKSCALFLKMKIWYEDEAKNEEEIDKLNLQEDFAKFIHLKLSNSSIGGSVKAQVLAYSIDLMKKVDIARKAEGLNVPD